MCPALHSQCLLQHQRHSSKKARSHSTGVSAAHHRWIICPRAFGCQQQILKDLWLWSKDASEPAHTWDVWFDATVCHGGALECNFSWVWCHGNVLGCLGLLHPCKLIVERDPHSGAQQDMLLVQLLGQAWMSTSVLLYTVYHLLQPVALFCYKVQS